MELTIEQIKELQKQYGYAETQKMIENGSIWSFEGSMGRAAMDMLEAGVCFLGENRTRDYYGSTIPSRNDLQAGTKGTLENSQMFWQKVMDGEIMLDEVEENNE
jgi:hypothetical protein